MAPKLLLASLLYCYSLLMITATAQKTPYFIEKITTAEGLSSNKINDIEQDDNGFLWIATSDGLNRFDGTEIKQYFFHEGANSIPHNYVYCLRKLKRKCLAIGTQAGLSFYDGNTGTFRNFYHSQNSKLDEYNNTIIELELDTKGYLWAASLNCIYVFDSLFSLKKIFNSPFKETDAGRKRLRYTAKMIPLSEGKVLLCLDDGWYISSAEAGAVTRLEQSGFKEQLDFIRKYSTYINGDKFEQYFPSAHVFKIFGKYLLCIKPNQDSLILMDELGHQLGSCFFPFNRYPFVLWSQQVEIMDSSRLFFLFHNYGLTIIPISWKNGVPAIHNPYPISFESTEYNDALCDRQGNWWLATTDEGLQKISPYKQSFTGGILVDDPSGEQIKSETNSICRFDHSIWISTYGNGFFRIDQRNLHHEQHLFHNTGDDLWANFIWNLCQVSPDTLWIGTQRGLFWFARSSQKYGRIPAFPGKPAAIDSVPITTQFLDSKGLIWMGLGRGLGLCYFNTLNHRFTYYPANSKEYPLRYPISFAENANGNLWFTNDASNLLVKWNRETNHFQIVSLPSTTKSQISNLYSIYCQQDSICWLGSVTGGLIKFNTINNTSTIYGHNKGLANSYIRSIWEDKARRLWLGTQGGLSCFDPRSETFFNYSANDGLPVKFPTSSFYYDTLDKRLYAGGKGAFFSFDPDSMSTSLPPQETIITALQVNGQPFMFQPGKPIKFSHQQDDITIHYAAIDLNGGPQTEYAYKLVGEDTGWILADHQRQINFSHLAPGSYKFVVRSQNDQGICCSKEASISFYISPPFTQTIGFYTLIILAIASLFYSLYRFRLRQLLRTEEIRNEISKNLHDEVGSTLTNISLGSLLAQKQLEHTGMVNPLLERIYQDSQTVSQTMREIVWSINPKIDTLGEALPRMLQYAAELLEAKNIELNAEIDPQIEQLKLSMRQRRDLYLVFKEAVNNLARHSGALRAQIRFELKGHILLMTIQDNGRGFSKSSPFLGNGLNNMKERADLHHWVLTIDSNPGLGTIFSLNVLIP
jgi:ligand-binding sensor domain-containing protein/two-component sensor histidine kinase